MGENHPLMSTHEYQAHVHVLKYTQMYTCICIHTTDIHSYNHTYIHINGCYKMILLIIMFLFSKACRVQKKKEQLRLMKINRLAFIYLLSKIKSQIASVEMKEFRD